MSATVGSGPLAEVRGLTVRFPESSSPALQDVDFAVYPGELVLVAGPSGSGKSTLALALGGYIAHRYGPAVSGRIEVGGRDARATPLPELAEEVALVQQSPESQLCTLVVGDEVAFGLENRELPPGLISERVGWALGVVGARHLIDRRLATLSGGEQQRVAIAAALAGRPRLLILDEPTASLDPKGAAEVLDLLGRLREQDGLAVVVIEHRLRRLLPIASRFVRLAEGRIVEDQALPAQGGRSGPGRTESARRTDESPAMTSDRSEQAPDAPGLEALAGMRPPHPAEASNPPRARTLAMLELTGSADAPIKRPGGNRERPSSPAIGATARPTGTSGPVDSLAISASDLRIERAGHTVLSVVSFEVRAGEFVALLGDNGSGKTSLLLSLIGLLRPAGGRLRVLGQDAAQVPVSRLARDVGFVFQNPDHQLFTASVWDEATFAVRNLGLAEPDFQPRLRDLLAKAGLADRLADHPQRLSHGQKRRLNVVSVVGHAPRLLLLDEPLVGQDPDNARLILDLLDDLRGGGVTVVAALHQPEVVRDRCDRLLFLRDGRLLVDAPPAEAFARLAELGEPDYLPFTEMDRATIPAVNGRGMDAWP